MFEECRLVAELQHCRPKINTPGVDRRAKNHRLNTEISEGFKVLPVTHSTGHGEFAVSGAVQFDESGDAWPNLGSVAIYIRIHESGDTMFTHIGDHIDSPELCGCRPSIRGNKTRLSDNTDYDPFASKLSYCLMHDDWILDGGGAEDHPTYSQIEQPCGCFNIAYSTTDLYGDVYLANHLSQHIIIPCTGPCGTEIHDMQTCCARFDPVVGCFAWSEREYLWSVIVPADQLDDLSVEDVYCRDQLHLSEPPNTLDSSHFNYAGETGRKGLTGAPPSTKLRTGSKQRRLFT